MRKSEFGIYKGNDIHEIGDAINDDYAGVMSRSPDANVSIRSIQFGVFNNEMVVFVVYEYEKE